jgi:uncharacterized protein RhaS with RHS repeats
MPLPTGQTTRPVTEYIWTNGRLTKTTSPLSEETFYISDDLRRTIQVDFPDGSKEQMLYDDANRDVYKRDRVGVVSKTKWNISDQVLTCCHRT